MIRQLDAAQWQQLRADDPYLRWGLDPGDPPLVWVADDGLGLVAISRLRRAGGPRSLLFIVQPEPARRPQSGPSGRSEKSELTGPELDRLADGVAAMAAQVLTLTPAGGLTVPRLIAGPVHERLARALPGDGLGGPAAGVGWDWTWSASRIAAPEREEAGRAVRAAGVRADLLDVANPLVANEIRDLLAATSPRHSAAPGDPRVRQWFGFRASDGELVACAAWYESVPGIPLLASVAVGAGYRRAGLGAAIMVTVTQAAFEAGCPAVTVDLYADNDPARQLYRKLGFVTAQEFASWPLVVHTQ